MLKRYLFSSLLVLLCTTGCEKHTDTTEKAANAVDTKQVALNTIADFKEFSLRLKGIESPLVRNTIERLAQINEASMEFKISKNAPQAKMAPPGDDAEIEAFPLRTVLWESPAIEVCWEGTATTFNSERLDVQQAITQTWQAASRLRFTGWTACPQTAPGSTQNIRIQIEDSGPHTKGLGTQLSGKLQGMVLNFTFQNWSPGCQAMRSYCIKGIAVHEFGHAIGFAHEQNRPDKPGECMNPRQGTDGNDILLTPYDRDSVMNYCNQKYNNDGDLSALDKSAVAALYGAP